MDIWDRQYRVRIGKNNSVGREIGKPNEKTKRAIRCSFSCEIGDSSSSNTGKITLWNLADETLRLLEQEDCLIELRAGYGDDLPVIMGGSLTCFETETNGADRQTTIEFVDSFTSARDTTVSLSYSGVVNGEKIVRDVAQEMGCEVKLSPKAKMIDFKNFAFVGTGKTLIGRLCDRSKLRWSVQNGIIQICALDEPLTMAAYVLSADSGMIGSPKPFFESASTSSKSSTSKNASSNTDINGNRQYLEFTRVNDVYLLLSVTVTSSGGLDDDYAARIKSLLMEEILSAGTTIRLQTFIRPIMESVSGVDYVEIRGLLSEKPDIEGVADNSMLTGIVPVEINQQPVLSMSGIRVVKA